MGMPSEVEGHSSSSQTKATFSGMTALIGVISFIVSIISIAVPHWGSYGPIGQAFFQAGLASQDNTGHFGPFQVCKYQAYYSFCGSRSPYTPTTWLLVAGICAIATVLALAFFSLFAVLHVAMQLQRREIMLSFRRDLFLKLVTSSIAVMSTIAGVIFGGIEFAVGGRNSFLQYRMGVCYYLQIFLIFVNALLVILSYMSYRKGRKHPLNIVPKGRGIGQPQSHDNGGVSMTSASGVPYGHPRMPIQYTFNNPNMAVSYTNGYNNVATIAGPQTPTFDSNGFTSVSLQSPAASDRPVLTSQPLPIQPIRPIQPVQGIPQANSVQSTIQPVQISDLPQVLPSSGVSFMPAGRSGYSKMISGPHVGSVESLESTQSLALSNLSFGSTVSTGSGHGPLRSSLKKPKNKDAASVSSKSSSKQVRISLGSEQTSV